MLSRLPWRYVLSHDPVAVHLRRQAGGRTPATLVVSFLTRLVLVGARLRWRWQVSGVLPAGGAVLVSAHTSYWDGVLASMLDPRVSPMTGRDWRSPAAVGWYLRTYGVLWTDQDPLREACALVARGEVVWIAPAGWEKRAQGALRRGAAEIARTQRVPVHVLRITAGRGRLRPRLRLALDEVAACPDALPLEDLNALLSAALRHG